MKTNKPQTWIQTALLTIGSALMIVMSIQAEQNHNTLLNVSYDPTREFYQDFIKPLYKRLFNLDVSLKDYAQCYGFEVCSRALWTFKTNVLKIPAGRKTGISITSG